MPNARLIALDWGTSNLRAHLLGAGGRVLEQRAAAAGVMQVEERRFEDALTALCGDWLAGARLPLLASGMIGSRQGWVEAPYLELPATLAGAAQALARVPLRQGGVLHVVPGLCRRSGGGDVMRGEETQLWGAGLPAGACCVLPGTHSKWAWMGEGGTIRHFATCLTGELYALLVRHSIIGRLLPDAPPRRPQAFGQGVREALAHPAQLTQRLFGVRAGVLLDQLAADDAADHLSGLLVGAELAAARADGLPGAVWLLGEPALVERYEQALAVAGIGAHRVDDGATVRGQWRLAVAAGLVEDES
ncbi:MAG: 2-dehydro-3-deoxygalactonokinase [Rubrivivax sp.]